MTAFKYRRKTSQKIIHVIALCFVISAVCLVYTKYIPRALVLWDEALYLTYIAKVSNAIQQQQVHNVLLLIRQQFIKPPLQSIIIGALVSTVGFTIQSARTIGLIWFILAAFFTYRTAFLIKHKNTSTIALLSLGLFLTSPLLLYMAAISMKEMMGVALTTITLYMYIKTPQKEKWRLIGTSLGIIVLAWTKNNFSLLVLLIISLEEAVRLATHKNIHITIQRMIILLVPYFVFMFWWIFLPTNKLQLFIQDLKATWLYTTPLTHPLEKYTYYFDAIRLTYAPTRYIGSIILLLLGISIRYRKESIIRFFHIAILTNILLGIQHSYFMQERFIITITPYIFLTVSATLVFLFSDILKNTSPKLQQKIVIINSTLLLIVCTHVLFTLPTYVYGVSSYAMDFPTFNQIDFDEQNMTHDPLTWAYDVPPNSADWPEDVLTFLQQYIDVSKPVEFIGENHVLSPWYLTLFMQQAKHKQTNKKINNISSYMVTTEIWKSSRFYTRDYIYVSAWKNNAIQQTIRKNATNLIAKRDFEDLGLTVHIFKKP